MIGHVSESFIFQRFYLKQEDFSYRLKLFVRGIFRSADVPPQLRLEIGQTLWLQGLPH